MKLIIFLSMLIIFISCIFIFFTFDSMIKTKLACDYGVTFSCNMPKLDFTIIFGILIIGILLSIDAIVMYVMIKTWVPGLLVYTPSQ
ncbi:MAG: hypothetical protein KAS04_03120 [Candidatus Aenigmarchaeota archaeon]|nr:hypothetical protein [Candidatus Aenigmarchaeota archaeon]